MDAAGRGPTRRSICFNLATPACTSSAQPPPLGAMGGGNICVFCHGERQTRAPRAKSLAAVLTCWSGWGCWGGGGRNKPWLLPSHTRLHLCQEIRDDNERPDDHFGHSVMQAWRPASLSRQVIIFGGRCSLCSQAAARLDCLVGKGGGFCCVTSLQE